MVLPYGGYLSGYCPFPVLFSQEGQPLFAHWQYPRSLPPRYIVIHYTGGGTFDANAVYLTRKNGRGVSIHFLIGMDGEVVLLCPILSIAYHAGKWSMNRVAVGIECVHGPNDDPYPEPQIEALVMLCAQLCFLFTIPPSNVIGHRDVIPTICPRALDVDWVRSRVIEVMSKGGDTQLFAFRARKTPSQPYHPEYFRLLRSLGRFRVSDPPPPLYMDTPATVLRL